MRRVSTSTATAHATFITARWKCWAGRSAVAPPVVVPGRPSMPALAGEEGRRAVRGVRWRFSQVV